MAQGLLLVDQGDPAVLREAAVKDAAARTFAATALRYALDDPRFFFLLMPGTFRLGPPGSRDCC